MSSVSGSDSNYNYYQKQVSDLADETSSERKKAKEREDERIAELERRQANELRDQEESYGRALSRSKEAANETLKTEREASKGDYDRLKKDTYDRYGRIQQDQSTDSKHTIDELQRNLEAERSRHDEVLRKTEASYQSRLGERDRNASRETERAVAITRDNLAAAQHASTETERAKYADLASKSSDRQQAIQRSHQEEMQTQRRKYDNGMNQARQDYDRRLEMAKNAYEKSTIRQENSLRDSRTDDANLLRQSHERETRNLRGKIGDLLQAEKTYMRDKGLGKAEAVADYEDEWRGKLDVAQSNFNNETADLRSQNERTESYLARQNNENVREKEAFFTHLLKDQNAEHELAQTEQLNSYKREREQMESDNRREKALQEKALENRIADISAESERGLTHQARIMGENLENQRKIDEYKINRLAQSLHEQETSADTTLVSPAAEAALRHQISGEFQKTAEADQERRKHENEEIRGEYQDRLKNETQRNLAKETHLNRTLVTRENDDRALFNAHVADLEYMKNSTLRSQERDHTRERDNMNRNFSRTLERQTKEHEEATNAALSQAQTRIAAQRQDFEFSQKMAQREFAQKYNETVRDYERKMNDQKNDYEQKLEDQRAQTATQARETERKYKASLDEQGRSYEQKIAQQDAQYRERERYMAQTYQDELEKARRANQMLVNKRG